MINKLLNFFLKKNTPSLYISRKPEQIGGGSNSFSQLFSDFSKIRGYRIVSKIADAQRAIIIAHLADPKDLIDARKKGCFIIHRLDEDFAYLEGEKRSEKHLKIIELNKYADLTIFQSQFVFDNIYPYIKPANYRIIHNGSDPKVFYPRPQINKKYIGHVSWSHGDKKRIDLLHKFVLENPQEQFLLVGRHKESGFDFNLPNVTIMGPVKRKNIGSVYSEMKMLYFPSERDPCPNTVVESILSGVPVCYNPIGGTVELVKNCGLPLSDVSTMLQNLKTYQDRCLNREDLYFENVLDKYLQ